MMENQNNPEKQYGGTDFSTLHENKSIMKGGKNMKRGRSALKTCSNFSFSSLPSNAMIVVYLPMTCCMLSFVL
jgi:hypothetical protein